ncbi:MAG: L-lactate dehydrogenase [Clostridiales bacterium]|nr:L-lactate dehydrogenase [Clostridiales bacterium]MCD7828275.1 L-lactate dehydrogenase [Clostridiales bacterium]
MNDNKKVAVIGTGFVGMSCAYALLNQNACDELLLIDKDTLKAAGEAMDLNHSLAFSPAEMYIHDGDYSECADADIAVISAGVSQKPGESRIELLKRNAAVFESVIIPVVESGFSGIFLIASNPVDIMSEITRRLSGFNHRKIIGSGTSLDTARLRYLLGHYFTISPKNVHAYVMGEHGDSEIIPWSSAFVGTKPILTICKDFEELYSLGEDVKSAAQKIINAKGATYYGIGMALVRIIKAVLNDENSILTVSSYLNGSYNVKDLFVGTPAIINRNGISDIVELNLTDEESSEFLRSCEFLKDITHKII